MRKAKLMLTGIVVFAVVGAALAFKAKRNSTIYCSTKLSTYGTTLEGFKTTAASAGVASFCTLTTASYVTATRITTAL
ncbi:hypothetical protein SAMN05518672_106159 [Chitinophaga sp. CF118]|uniref:hypothetical protein n=1 Tax=Chitinophaga sp. CF118 TaxID=1884367 RepID=UPI0008EEBA99|nr:hypothetical protein [Chitinophaga sp. CF118]SFE44863.1 hypothetical protein SAMN05518672_106159 [Chitinophaga sp. CF118]